MLASSRGGNGELVRDGINGFVFDPDDDCGFRLALRKIVDRRVDLSALRRGCRDSAHAFDVDRFVTDYASLYARAVSASGAGVGFVDGRPARGARATLPTTEPAY